MPSSRSSRHRRKRLVLRPPGEEPLEACRACGVEFPESTLDEARWCPQCHADLETAAARGQHVIALLVTLPFAIWIVREGTRGYFPLYAWAIPLAAAYYLGMRIGREVVRGWTRSRRRS
ncbi:MAG: hypothetical protein R6X22_02450 [Gemmatimonadota bacterium]